MPNDRKLADTRVLTLCVAFILTELQQSLKIRKKVQYMITLIKYLYINLFAGLKEETKTMFTRLLFRDLFIHESFYIYL